MTLIEILLVSVAIGVVWAWKKDREINFSNTLKVGLLFFLYYLFSGRLLQFLQWGPTIFIMSIIIRWVCCP